MLLFPFHFSSLHPLVGAHEEMVCPKLRELRAELRMKSGDAFRSLASLLGGPTKGEKGKPGTISRSKAVQAVLDFAELHSRFVVVYHEGNLIMGTATGPAWISYERVAIQYIFQFLIGR